MTDKCKDCGRGDVGLALPGPRCKKCLSAQKKATSRRAWVRNLRTKDGLSEEQYWAMHQEQGGRCALCQVANGTTKRLAVDHDHKTGLVRGLACGPCNHIVIGRLAGDDPGFFRRGYVHLTNGAAKRLGIEARKPERET